MGRAADECFEVVDQLIGKCLHCLTAGPCESVSARSGSLLQIAIVAGARRSTTSPGGVSPNSLHVRKRRSSKRNVECVSFEKDDDFCCHIRLL
ncbi:MAG TPA: hypothetical protein VGN10_20050 [Pyrinomonadaceae bacterium]